MQRSRWGFWESWIRGVGEETEPNSGVFQVGGKFALVGTPFPCPFLRKAGGKGKSEK